MMRSPIAGRSDVREVEARGLGAYMSFGHVHDALADVARRFGDRPALCALARADDAAPRRWTHAGLLDEVRRAANLFQALADGAAPPAARTATSCMPSGARASSPSSPR